MGVALALIQHDPHGQLFDQTMRVLPGLQQVFGVVVVCANSATAPQTLEYLAQHGVRVAAESLQVGLNHIGWFRRGAVQLALQGPCPFILYCDFDRALHWMEWYPHEFAAVARRIRDADFTVLGRTPRAFNSHPRMQRDTEAIINHVFCEVSGLAWDVTAAARGLSRRAASTLLAQCPDEQISTDVTWPLCAQRAGFTLEYLETEGLEFETADRFPAEVVQAGGLPQWIDRLDGDPQGWAMRLELARIEVDAMIPFASYSEA